MNRIKVLRAENGVKQIELAAFLNVAQNTLSAWERGAHEPDIDNIKKIAEYFNTTTDYILGITSDPTPLGKKEKAPSAETEREKNLKYLSEKIRELEINDLIKVDDYIDLLIHRHNK